MSCQVQRLPIPITEYSSGATCSELFGFLFQASRGGRIGGNGGDEPPLRFYGRSFAFLPIFLTALILKEQQLCLCRSSLPFSFPLSSYHFSSSCSSSFSLHSASLTACQHQLHSRSSPQTSEAWLISP